MPIHTGQDKNGKFYQWGKTGKKYYFKPEDKQSKQRALNKAKKQQTAIYSSGWKGDTMKLIKVRKGDVKTSSEELKKFQSDFNSCKKKLDEAWSLITDGYNEASDAADIAQKLPPEMKQYLFNSFSKISSQASNIVQYMKQVQDRLLK